MMMKDGEPKAMTFCYWPDHNTSRDPVKVSPDLWRAHCATLPGTMEFPTQHIAKMTRTGYISKYMYKYKKK